MYYRDLSHLVSQGEYEYREKNITNLDYQGPNS